MMEKSKLEKSKNTLIQKKETLDQRFNIFRLVLEDLYKKNQFTNYYGIYYKIIKEQDALKYLLDSDLKKLNQIKYTDPMLKGIIKSKKDLVVSVIDYENVDSYFDYRVIT